MVEFLRRESVSSIAAKQMPRDGSLCFIRLRKRQNETLEQSFWLLLTDFCLREMRFGVSISRSSAVWR